MLTTVPRLASVRIVDKVVLEFHAGCPQLVSSIEHPAHPHTLIKRQRRWLPTDNYGALPQCHIETCNHQLPSLCALYQPFNHRLLDTTSKRQARVWTGLRHFKLAPGPLAAHQHLTCRRHTGTQLQPLKAASAINRADGAGLPQPRCPFDTGRHDFSLGIAQAADPHGLTWAQPFSYPRASGQPHGLAHDPQRGRGIGQRRQRPFEDVEDRNAPRLQAALGGECLHRHHLPDRQVTTAGRRTVFTHRYVLAIVHFHAIDADRGEAGDGTDDACTPSTTRAQDRRTGTTSPPVALIKVGAVHTLRHRACAACTTRALLDWGTGATDAAIFIAHTGAAHTAGKLQACGTGHTHLVTADTHRRCGHLGRGHQVPPENQGKHDSTEVAHRKCHGPGIFDGSESVASV
ncbi:hypothetical protein D3C80_846510 [compost metagenome]